MNERVDLTENRDFKKKEINIDCYISNFSNLDSIKKNEDLSFLVNNSIMYQNISTISLYQNSNGFNEEFNPLEKNNDIPAYTCNICGDILIGLIEDPEDSICITCKKKMSNDFKDIDNFIEDKNDILKDDFDKFERIIWL